MPQTRGIMKLQPHKSPLQTERIRLGARLQDVALIAGMPASKIRRFELRPWLATSFEVAIIKRALASIAAREGGAV
jgi:hypothetical protein